MLEAPKSDPTLRLFRVFAGVLFLVGCLVQQRLQGRVLQRRRGLRIVQDLLESVVHTLRLPDLLYRAAVIPCVAGCGDLSAQDEVLQCREVWKALISFDVPENRVEKLHGLRGEVHHVSVPRAVEARREKQPRVIVEQHEPGFVNRRDGQVVVSGPIPRTPLERRDRASQGVPMARLDAEEQAELARRADAHARSGHSYLMCRHWFLPWIWKWPLRLWSSSDAVMSVFLSSPAGLVR